MKNGKAAGSSGILPEMLKVGQISHEFLYMRFALVRAVRREKCVPPYWRDAILVPVPMEDNLNCCDNWRDIALMDVVGKLVGQVIQNRLQQFAERVLPELQWGF